MPCNVQKLLEKAIGEPPHNVATGVPHHNAGVANGHAGARSDQRGVPFRIEERSERNPERRSNLLALQDGIDVADPVDERRNHQGQATPARASFEVREPAERTPAVEGDSDLFERLALGRRPDVSVAGFDPSSREGHVPGPRISRPLRALDEEKLRVALRRPRGAKQQRDGGVGTACRVELGRPVGREGTRDRLDAEHPASIAPAAGRPIERPPGGPRGDGYFAGMASAPAAPTSESQRVLDLARRDPRAGREALARLPSEALVALVCEAPAAERAALLELVPEPERVIPSLPEAELCFAVKAAGLADAGWILAHATDEQIVACADLDAWSGFAPDRERLDAWLDAAAEAGDETLARVAQILDLELLVLWLRERSEVWLKPRSDETEPPSGARTLDGQFFLRPRAPGDELVTPLRLLDAVFQRDYWLYFRLLQGVLWETPSETEESALRWRTGRLADLGFPSWEEATRVYAYLRPDERAHVPETGPALEVEAWSLPVWMPTLPTPADARQEVFRAAAALDEASRQAFLYALIALANKVAVADRLPLGEPESITSALEKVTEVTSRALVFLARENAMDGVEVLRRTSLERLFRVGANLDGDPAQRAPAPKVDREPAGS